MISMPFPIPLSKEEQNGKLQTTLALLERLSLIGGPCLSHALNHC